MLLEELAKETLVGEVEIFCNFLDVHARSLQQNAELVNDIIVYPFVGRAMADNLYSLRKVFGRNVKLKGIPANAAFFTEIFLHHVDELGEDNFSPCRFTVVVLLA